MRKSIFILLLFTISMQSANLLAIQSTTTQKQLLQRLEYMELKVSQLQALQRLKDMEFKVAQLQADKLTAKQKGSFFSGNTYSQKMLAVLSTTKDVFKFGVDKIDKIISKKAFIAAMMIIGPAFGLYYHFFDPFILQKIMTLFFYSSAETAVNVTDSMIDGIVGGLLRRPWTLVKLGGIMAVNNVLVYGIPFVLKGIVAKSFGIK